MSIMQAATLPLVFDYSDLDPETRIVVQQKTGEIRERIKRTANDLVEIGERLTDVKARLGHGRFGQWLHGEFAWSEQTARNLMNVAEVFKTTNFVELTIAPSAMYAIAAPSVPAEARQEAVELATNGHHVTHAEAKQIIARHKPIAEPAQPVRTGLFGDDDTPPEPAAEDEGDDGDGPSTAILPDQSPEKWAKILSNCLALSGGVKTRGGFSVFAKSWSRTELKTAKNYCDTIIESFTEYRSQLRDLLR